MILEEQVKTASKEDNGKIKTIPSEVDKPQKTKGVGFLKKLLPK